VGDGVVVRLMGGGRSRLWELGIGNWGGDVMGGGGRWWAGELMPGVRV
jgi:hypothetical protein